MLSRVTRALGWLIYGILLLAIFTFAGYFSFNMFVRSGVTQVPDLVGMPETGIEANLIDHGLSLRRLSRRSTATCRVRESSTTTTTSSVRF